METFSDSAEVTTWINTTHQAMQSYLVDSHANYIEANQLASRSFDTNFFQMSAVWQKL